MQPPSSGLAPPPATAAPPDVAVPRIAVIVPTVGRGASVLRVIDKLRQGTWRHFEICVIDQNIEGHETEAAVATLGDGRIRYLSMNQRGLARAINRGVAAVAADLIAITGDDCEPAADWLERIVTTFDGDETIGVVHGNVEPCSHDPKVDFVQASVRSDATTASRPADLPSLIGTSANMALRRSAFIAVDGFDEELGVGGKLLAGEDVDFVLRALCSGWRVREDPLIRVTHLDIWPLRRCDELVDRNWFGTGAVIAKFTRLQPRSAFALLCKLAGRWVAPPIGVSSAVGGRRWRRLVAFAHGFLIGLTVPLDRSRGHFRQSPLTPSRFLYQCS